jgi:hypothetical protein
MTPKWLRKQRAGRASLLGAVQPLKVEPDDVLVFEATCAVTAQVAEQVKEKLRRYLPNPVVILGDGHKLHALR